ncbi:MAG: T9SS type A sorting domain-containing protein [Ignavibacteriales bacterium]|nr:T9SS type A sorting domain-containing protein [Ignavibacteriales bacterium]
MKKIVLILLLAFSIQNFGYEKLSIIERFTNASCPPCASINNDWYNSLVTNLIDSQNATHIIYNVWWPGSSDPMFLFNQDENVAITNYYNVNAVPTIVVNGSICTTAETAVQNAVDNGNSQYTPFLVKIVPIYYSSNRINVSVKIIRDASDTSTPENLRLKLALTEKLVIFDSPPGSNGENQFSSVCRKLLPDEQGTSFETPAAGDSIEINLEFYPNEEFISTVDVNKLRAVAFIQNQSSKEIYQSIMEDVVYVKQLEAIFAINEHVGISPFTVKFYDQSTSTDSTQIITWEWDFNNDGIIDSEEQEPTWTFEDEGEYVVSLTVKDGIETYKKVKNSFVNVVGNAAKTLVVNGINYSDYQNEMKEFYDNSVCFAGNEVDIWDLYGDQTFNYSSNAIVKRTHLYNQYIPSDVLNLYEKVIWIEDHHLGGTLTEMGDQIIDYINQGGNFLLTTSHSADFFNENLMNYCGVSRFSPNSTVNGISAIDPNLFDQTVSSVNTLIQFARLNDSSSAVPIFTRIGSESWIAGFTFHKGDGAGGFIYLGGSPQLFDVTSTTQNYNYIIENWLRFDPVVNINDNNNHKLTSNFRLDQNYPNPFNPNTIISYTIPQIGDLSEINVKLKIYDVLGKQVKVLVNQVKKPGNYEVDFNATNLTSGVYYYQLSAGEYLQTKKMILLK